MSLDLLTQLSDTQKSWSNYYALNQNEKELKATARLIPMTDSSVDLTLGYLLIADGLSDAGWGQANSYWNDDASKQLPGNFFRFPSG